MDQTFTPEMVTPQWVAILCVAGLIILFGPRKYVLPTFLVVATLLSLYNRVYIFGLNFFTSRILLALAWVRILSRGEHRGLELLAIDKAWILFCLWGLLTETLQRGIPGFVFGVANRIYDSLGLYFLVRICLQDSKLPVLRQLIACLGVICSVLAAFMLAEYFTQRNWLTSLGAVFQVVQERAGRMRCQATFLHPVLAGTYGGVLFPIFAACWWQPRMKRLAIAGCLASTVMVITAGSGGPFMTFVAVLVGLCLWPLRANLRPLRWALVLTLLDLQLVMKAPVWFLIARFHFVAGASSFHRAELIDAFVHHFFDWWLIGVQNTGDWGFETDDVANAFLVVAKHAGLLGLILFIRVLSLCFRELGILRRDVKLDQPTEIMVWACGTSLFAHVVSFFGTSYFDQINVLWHFTLAILASLPLLTRQPEEVTELEVFKKLEPVAQAHTAKLLPAI